MTATLAPPTTTHAPTPKRSHAQRAVPLLVVTAVAVLAQLYVSIPLRAPVGHELGMSGVTEALSSGYAICYALGFLIYGPLSDHVGRRPVLLTGLGVLAVTTAGVGMTNSIALLAAMRALQGAAAATFAPTALAYLGENLPPQRRAGAIGAMSVAFLAAGVIGQVAATAIAQAWGWRWVFFAGAILLAALGVALAALIPTTARPQLTDSLGARYAQLARFATRGPALVLSVGHLMVLGGFVGFYTLIGPHLAQHGLSANEIMTVRAAALPAMFMSLAAGPLMRRYGTPATTTGSYLVAAIGLTLACLSAGNTLLLTGASIIFVAGVATAVPCLITIWGDASAPQRGIGMAVNGFVLFLGASLGAYAPNLATGFTTPLAILATGYAIAAGLVLTAARTLHTRR